jgi:hypothetical protein
VSGHLLNGCCVEAKYTWVNGGWFDGKWNYGKCNSGTGRMVYVDGVDSIKAYSLALSRYLDCEGKFSHPQNAVYEGKIENV